MPPVDDITPDSGNVPKTKESGLAAIHNILSEEEAPAPQDKPREAEQSASDGDEPDDTPASASEPDGDDGDDGADDEPDAASDPDEELPRYRLRDGTEATLDEIEEWRKGNLRQSDYTRKTQELASARKAFEEKQTEIVQQAQRFDEEVNFAIEVARQYLPQPPDPSMMDTDPLGYLRAKEDFEARRNQLGQLYQAKAQNDHLMQQQQMEAFEQMKTREGESLLEKRPHLKDPKRVEQFQKDLLELLPYYGYAPDDLKSVYDHRLVMIMEDAAAWRKLQKSKPKVQAKSKDAAPVPVVQPTGKRRTENELRAQDRQAKRRELKKTGSKHVAASIIKDLL